jgi:hypothetical protein
MRIGDRGCRACIPGCSGKSQKLDSVYRDRLYIWNVLAQHLCELLSVPDCRCSVFQTIVTICSICLIMCFAPFSAQGTFSEPALDVSGKRRNGEPRREGGPRLVQRHPFGNLASRKE